MSHHQAHLELAESSDSSQPEGRDRSNMQSLSLTSEQPRLESGAGLAPEKRLPKCSVNELKNKP